MKMRDDIDIHNTWIVADTHFGHDNIVGFCHRPEDHEQLMIAEWRKEVPDDATVLHLGDLSYKGNARFKNLVAPELTGRRKLLIEGNHDKQRFSFYRDCGFRVVKPFAIEYGWNKAHEACPEWSQGDSSYKVRYEPFIVSFNHYPWNERSDGVQRSNVIRVHGHIHNNGYTRDAYVPMLRNHINVGVELTKYKPVNLGLLLAAYIYGVYPGTTEAQLAEAAARKGGKRS